MNRLIYHSKARGSIRHRITKLPASKKVNKNNGQSWTVRCVRRAKARSFSGCESRPAAFAPAGSNRGRRGGNETSEASDVEGHESDLASVQAVTRVNAEQASKGPMRKPTRHNNGAGRSQRGRERIEHPVVPPGYWR